MKFVVAAEDSGHLRAIRITTDRLLVERVEWIDDEAQLETLREWQGLEADSERDREDGCLHRTDWAKLHQRGAETGWREFVEAIEREVLPLFDARLGE